MYFITSRYVLLFDISFILHSVLPMNEMDPDFVIMSQSLGTLR